MDEHTHTDAHRHTHKHTHTHTNTHTHRHTHTNTHARTDTHTHTHSCAVSDVSCTAYLHIGVSTQSAIVMPTVEQFAILRYSHVRILDNACLK